jgi:hypothetical protein
MKSNMECRDDKACRRGLYQGLVPFVLLAVASSSSCGAGESASDEQQVETRQSALFANNGVTLWNKATSTTDPHYGFAATVNVCFSVRTRLKNNGTVSCAQGDAMHDCDGLASKPDPSIPGGGPPIALDQNVLRPFIKKWILQTWAHAGQIDFEGWGDCFSDGDGFQRDAELTNTVVIQFKDTDNTFNEEEDPTTRRYRAGVSTKGPTVVTYNWVWFMVAARGTPVDSLFNLIHEFGHALGFAHEWERPGYVAPAGCDTSEDPSETSGLAITPFIDYKSIMDKCQPTTGIFSLSPGDVVGVQQAYGRQQSGTLINFNGLCADIAHPGDPTTIGASIVDSTCLRSGTQDWTRGSATQRFQSNLYNGTLIARCLNVSGGVVSSTSPTVVGSWTCDPVTNEQFPMSGLEWRGMGSMCVASAGGVGSGILVNACDGSSSQKWTFLDGDSATSLQWGQIQATGTNLCVSTQTTSGAFGEMLVLRTCAAADPRQTFSYPGQGIVAFGSWCMNVSGGLPTPGSPIALWNGCTAYPRPYNEQFTVSGNIKTVPLRNEAGRNVQQCLDGSNVNQVTVSTCQSSSTSPQIPNDQIWEYYL